MDYLNVSEDLKKFVRKQYNVNEDDIRELVRTLLQWYEEQTDYPRLPDAEIYCENALLWNKFRMERTKQKLESYYSIKKQLGDEFQLNMCDIIPSSEPTIFLPLPQVTIHKKERIILWVLRDTNPSNFNFERIVQQAFLLFTMLIKYDYSTGNRFLIDSSGVQIGHIFKVNPIGIAKYVKVYLNNLNHKFCGMDFINMPPMRRGLFLLIKSLFPKKLAERINIHKNLDSLYEIIPKACLPEEYDGLLGPTNKLAETFNEEFLEQKDELHKFIMLKTKEKSEKPKQIAEEENSESSAEPFKNLTID